MAGQRNLPFAVTKTQILIAFNEKFYVISISQVAGSDTPGRSCFVLNSQWDNTLAITW